MNILLVSSTSLASNVLANKIEDASKMQGRDDKIKTIGQTDISKKIKWCDVILLCPQMKNLLHKIEPLAKKYKTPLYKITLEQYKNSDGSTILQCAKDTLAKV